MVMHRLIPTYGRTVLRIPVEAELLGVVLQDGQLFMATCERMEPKAYDQRAFAIVSPYAPITPMHICDGKSIAFVGMAKLTSQSEGESAAYVFEIDPKPRMVQIQL